MLQAVRLRYLCRPVTARGFQTSANRHQTHQEEVKSSDEKIQEQEQQKPVDPGHTEGENKEALDNAVDKVRTGLQSARKKAFQELRGNVEIRPLHHIIKDNDELMEKRYIKPLKRWSGSIKADAFRALKNSGITTDEAQTLTKGYTGQVMEKALGTSKTSIKATDLFSPLNVGDAVELSSSLNQSVFAVIVSVPFSENDPRYTVMTRLGELIYVEKSAFKFRIPGVIPKTWVSDIVSEIKDSNTEYGSIKTLPEGFKRFMVNPLARQIISQPLIDLTNSAWEKIQQTSRKLEIIHRILETHGPREVSLLSLVRATEFISLEEFETLIKDEGVIVAYKKLGKSLSVTAGVDFQSGLNGPILGKEYGTLSSSHEYDISLIFSVVLTLRKQTALWSAQNRSRSAFMPLSITVLPMTYSARLLDTVDKLKNPDNKLMNAFRDYIDSASFDKIPHSLQETFFLLKEYAVGNITDPISETVVCQLMKKHSDSSVTQSLVWDLLVRVGYIDLELTNPQHFTNSLAFPGKGVSLKADLESEFFEMCDVDERDGVDRATKRVDMKHLRVFCIDSATAHEIDDGVSIEPIDEQRTRLHIHVADPTSYLQTDSTMMKIAFERAFTTYQPETISAMFPRRLSDAAGLGVDGRETRAMTFSVEVNSRTGEVDFDSAEVNATVVSQFPKYTYDDVDAAMSQLISGNMEHSDLKNMSDMSLLLRSNRIRDGAIVYPDSLSVQVRIEPKIAEESSDGADDAVSFDGQKSTPSVVLVTEFMILANRLAATVLSRIGSPGVFKAMPTLPLKGSAACVVRSLNEKSQTSDMALADMVKSFKFVTPAIYSHEPGLHLMLGVKRYAPSTSPLRRFGDVVNHLQFHAHLNGEENVFTKQQLASIVLHIEARNDVLKKASRGALAYYSMKTLAERVQGDGRVLGRFIVVSHSVNNVVNGLLLEFGVFGTMELQEGRHPPNLGDIMENFTVKELDPVGQTLVLQEC